jgi:hypothetical protein
MQIVESKKSCLGNLNLYDRCRCVNDSMKDFILGSIFSETDRLVVNAYIVTRESLHLITKQNEKGL